MHPRHDRPYKHSDANTAILRSQFSVTVRRGAVSQRSLLRAGADAGVLHPAAADAEEEEGSEVLGPRMRAVWLRHPGRGWRNQGGEGCRAGRRTYGRQAWAPSLRPLKGGSRHRGV